MTETTPDAPTSTGATFSLETTPYWAFEKPEVNLENSRNFIGKTIYDGQALPKQTRVKKPSARAEKIILQTELTLEGQLALQVFLKYGATRVGGPLVSESQIKRDYRDLVRKFHPDMAPQEAVSSSIEIFLSVKEAYQILIGLLKTPSS